MIFMILIKYQAYIGLRVFFCFNNFNFKCCFLTRNLFISLKENNIFVIFINNGSVAVFFGTNNFLSSVVDF